jgi:hypothetical protein
MEHTGAPYGSHEDTVVTVVYKSDTQESFGMYTHFEWVRDVPIQVPW